MTWPSPLAIGETSLQKLCRRRAKPGLRRCELVQTQDVRPHESIAAVPSASWSTLQPPKACSHPKCTERSNRAYFSHATWSWYLLLGREMEVPSAATAAPVPCRGL